MALIPLRDLGQVGVITDTDTMQLPPNAFSMALNARFDAKGIMRGPVFKTAGTLVAHTDPRYVVSYKQLSDIGLSMFLIANDDGTVTRWSAGPLTGGPSVETNVTATGWTPDSYNQPYTATMINNVVYLNRPDRVPWYMAADGAQFATLPNWDSTWRAKVIRSVGGVVVALNISKGGTSYPTMVKTSDLMTFGNVPGSWNASTTNSATENIISELMEPLVDAAVLRDRLVLYAPNYTWIMEPTYDNNMFSYRRIFSRAGSISANCSVDVDNTHYVFGPDDIWTHDGVSRQSIANLKIREFIYEHIIRTEAWQCFVMHNRKLNEVAFCYVSNDEYCAFPALVGASYPGCNRAVVFNYRSNTWTFYDLPYLRSFGEGVGTANKLWSSFGTLTWPEVGGTWASFVDVSKLSVLTVSPTVTGKGITTDLGVPTNIVSAIRSFEKDASLYDVGIIDPTTNAPVIIENAYVNLDAVAPEYRAYRVATAVYPNARFADPNSFMTVSLAGSDYASSPIPVYGAEQVYDGKGLYKCDFMNQGRYMSFKITYKGYRDFLLTGMDVDLKTTGHR